MPFIVPKNRGKVAAATNQDKDKHKDYAEQDERKGVLRSALQAQETKTQRTRNAEAM